jgi:predicted nucleic acid-binding protein
VYLLDANVDDAMFAATATVHNLTVVTRNVRKRLRVPTFNPFEAV